MSSEKNDSLTSTNIELETGNGPIAEPKSGPEKETEPLPKRSKLTVRITGRNLKTEETAAVKRDKDEEMTEKISPEHKKKGKRAKRSKGGADAFRKASHRVGEVEKTNAKANAKTDKISGKKKPENQPRPVGLYRKIFVFFVVLTLALVAMAFYFFFVTLTIEVTPKAERISDKLNVTIYNGGQGTEGISFPGQESASGLVEQIPIKDKKTYPATGEEMLGQEIIGQVEIINNYSQGKTLVATTRLLSPEGKLFRIKNQVEIPAGGSQKVDIYSDEPSQDMAIGPTEFTIPGLWAGLQDKIYAKSDKAFVYQINVRKFVQAVDIERAFLDSKETLVREVNDQFGENYKGFDKIIAEIDKDSLHSSSSAVAKDKVNEFTVAINAQVDVIAFKSSDLEKLVKDKLISIVPSNKKLIELEKDKLEYNLVSANFLAGTATLEVPFVGAVTLSNTDNIFNKEKLIGLTATQITNYLRSLDKFSDIKLIFTPPFINKAPSLVDRIKIIIK